MRIGAWSIEVVAGVVIAQNLVTFRPMAGRKLKVGCILGNKRRNRLLVIVGNVKFDTNRS